MRIIEVALRYGTPLHEIALSISNLFRRRECGSVQASAVEKGRNQTSNLRVGSSNLSERAISGQTWAPPNHQFPA